MLVDGPGGGGPGKDFHHRHNRRLLRPHPNKWNISTVIRGFYWSIFVLVGVLTFLRTVVVIRPDSSSPSSATKTTTTTGGENQGHDRILTDYRHQQDHDPSNLQQNVPPPPFLRNPSSGISKNHNGMPSQLKGSRHQEEQRQRHEQAIIQLKMQQMTDQQKSKIQNENMLDDDDRVWSDIQEEKRRGGSSNGRGGGGGGGSQTERRGRSGGDIEDAHEHENNGKIVHSTSRTEEKTDWWKVLNNFHQKPRDSSPVEEDETQPKSKFVQHLYDLKNELSSDAASTARVDENDGNHRTAWTNTELAKPPPDQPVEFLTSILSTPTAIFSPSNSLASVDDYHRDGRSKIVVLVLSHQKSYIKRQAIRETWAKKYSSNVLFVVAQSSCGNNREDRSSTRSELSNIGCSEKDHDFLRNEQSKYGDLLEIPIIENYGSLPEKLLQAYHWVLNNVRDVEWIVKSDDDMMVRVTSLERYLRKYNPSVPMVVGDIIYHSQVRREGKWAERRYPRDFYPYWPRGSAGHAVSRGAVDYFSRSSSLLHRYQGEDVSIGIWLHKARKPKYGGIKDVTYIHAKHTFTKLGKNACQRSKFMVIGHDFRPDALLECTEKYENDFKEKAWLDDPSEFEDIIAQEEVPGSNSFASKAHEQGWHPSIGYNNNQQQQ